MMLKYLRVIILPQPVTILVRFPFSFQLLIADIILFEILTIKILSNLIS